MKKGLDRTGTHSEDVNKGRLGQEQERTNRKTLGRGTGVSWVRGKLPYHDINVMAVRATEPAACVHP